MMNVRAVKPWVNDAAPRRVEIDAERGTTRFHGTAAYSAYERPSC